MTFRSSCTVCTQIKTNIDFQSRFVEKPSKCWFYDIEETCDKMTAIRQRKKTFPTSVEELDAFPKVEESYVEQEASSAIGMILSGFY